MTTQLETQQSCQTEKLLKNIRKTPLFRQLIPQEAGIGFPIPLRREIDEIDKEKKVYAILPCFGFTPVKKGEALLFPPFAKITVQWSNQLPVEYVNLRFSNPAPKSYWAKSIGTYPHNAVAGMTLEEHKTMRLKLLQMYDEMFISLEEGNGLSSEWKQQFSELFSILIEPPLIPHYRTFGAKFCQKFLLN